MKNENTDMKPIALALGDMLKEASLRRAAVNWAIANPISGTAAGGAAAGAAAGTVVGGIAGGVSENGSVIGGAAKGAIGGAALGAGAGAPTAGLKRMSLAKGINTKGMSDVTLAKKTTDAHRGYQAETGPMKYLRKHLPKKNAS